MPTFLVTGGCGFIGTWVLRDLLQLGFPAVVLDAGSKPPRWQTLLGAEAAASVPLVTGSLLDRPLLRRTIEEHQVTHILHLAALLTPACQADPWVGCELNVLGTVALFEEARRCGERIESITYASSVAVFGNEPDHAAGAPPHAGNQPETFYGAFKKATESFADQYWRHFRIPSVGIRPQVAYGPERTVGLTAGPSLAARAAATGQAYTIGYTGRVGYDYVEDVAKAFVRSALEAPPGAHVVDLEGPMATVEDVVAAIEAAAPGAAARLRIDGPVIPAHAPPHPHFIRHLLPNWRTTNLAEGIRRTVDWYRQNAIEQRAVESGPTLP